MAVKIAPRFPDTQKPMCAAGQTLAVFLELPFLASLLLFRSVLVTQHCSWVLVDNLFVNLIYQVYKFI